MTIYSAPIDDMMFLFEHLKDNKEYNEIEKNKEVTSDLVKNILEEAAKINQDLILPLAKVGDEKPCIYENGVVRTPPGYKEVYSKFIEDGWVSLSCDPEYGGQGMPKTVSAFFDEMLSSSSLSFKLYSELSIGAYNCLKTHGSEEIKNKYLPKIVEGKWSGTMCLTEPQCGTDLGLIKTKAVKNGNGYKISGQKIFITSGDHDLTENIIHLVLARTTDAPKGTRGISLFLVPKYEINDDGSVGSRNGVNTVSIESKMGIKGSATCVLSFDEAKGYMIGPENKGLNSMFTMMNLERIIVGIQGLGISETAYQTALSYAKERKQGKSNENKNGDTDLIIQHADIRRSLMNMKSIIEGERALSFWMAQQIDVSLNHNDQNVKKKAGEMVSLMTPVIKSFFTDMAMDITNEAIQIFGGYGYTKDQGIEQLFRDNRITPIYEGTNSVQAIDFVFRKVSQKNIFTNFLSLIDEEIKLCKSIDKIKDKTLILENLKDILIDFTKWMDPEGNTPKDDISASCNDYLKYFGYTSLAFVWLKVLRKSYENHSANKEFYDDKINTGNYYFDKIVPRADSHYKSAISGSKYTMSAKFN
ncbi:acyl-CoA dehydrogenase family protein [Candidatus Pelagibacter sp. RS40]|jgi:alkylation response protein AidB-like acyl-CoA dehydrogenase|uniref:acyl-CoA dehydrogenase family protein n=1 Tax=Candidatus Pelagibacter sp. RS40 TaxID=1977865 RepID=UPI000A149275|nr:acyl-CoA dehydrogenase family protein [Candidatus Pelagibacter sp. RS40]ARJ48967.1 acyl-CoA dehydrogenase [Candidatus Pelagibacter sp. RS40]